MKALSFLSALIITSTLTSASAQTIAQWTFETSIPTTAGPHAAEVGTGNASASHAGAAVYSNPVGNGSAESFSANTWAVNDYFQFRLGTVGFSKIGVSFDQTSSNTGPRDYDLSYSTDGVNFTLLASYSVLANASPNPAWSSGTYQGLFNFNYDLSSISALDNAADVYFRLVNTSTVSANGGTVAAAGTSRLDNFTVYVVPEPTGLTLAALGFGLLLAAQRFIRRN